MSIWSDEIKDLEKLHDFIKGQFPDLEKELAQLIRNDDPNVILLYSRRCLEVIITDICECELKRPRGTEPLKGIIDKLLREKKIPPNIITSMHGLNDLSTYGTHPKDFDPAQVKPVLSNLDIIIKWYHKYRGKQIVPETITEAKDYVSKNLSLMQTEKSIAVLPFVNMSPEKDQDYFCDGITEEIINVLTHIEGFKVIARTSAFAFKDKHIDIREIGRALDVETLLEGSIRKAGPWLRITAQLIRVADGSHIWSEHYDRELKDVFAIQDEISQAIAVNLKVSLLGETKKRITKRHSENIEAYNLYLKGIYSYQGMTEESFKNASEYFEQALLMDPHYALAYAGLGYVSWLSTMWGKNISPDEAYPKANEYVTKALKINDNLGEAYSVLAITNTFYYWNWKEAERNFRRALQISPNSAMIHMNYSVMLIFTGRHEEAVSEASRAKELDPLSYFVNTRTGMILGYAGQHEMAIQEFRMALTLNPDFFFTHFNLGNTYRLMNMFEEAIVEYKKAIDLSNGTPIASAMLGLTYYQTGKTEESEKLFASLRKRAENEYVPATCFFLLYDLFGNNDLALKWLKRACIEHDSFLPWIRAYPGQIPEGSVYMKLLKEMGLS